MAAGTCGNCGREFTGLATFDRHQDVAYTRRPPVICLDPATVGLVQDRNGRWGTPADDAARERLASLRAGRAGDQQHPESLRVHAGQGDERGDDVGKRRRWRWPSRD